MDIVLKDIVISLTAIVYQLSAKCLTLTTP